MKKILWFLLLLLAVVLWKFDDIVKYSVESIATEALQTPVQVGDVNSDFSRAQLNLDFVEVNNASGFKHPQAFRLNHVNLEIASFDDKLLAVSELRFDGAQFFLEQNKRRVNLLELFNRLEQRSTQHRLDANTAQSKQPHQLRVRIERLVLVNSRIQIDSEFLQDTVALPDVVIHNLGGDGGMPIKQLGVELMRIVLSRVQEQLQEQGLQLSEDQIKAGIRKKLKHELQGLEGKLGDKAQDLLDKLSW